MMDLRLILHLVSWIGWVNGRGGGLPFRKVDGAQAELNRRRQPFQGCALPTELPGHPPALTLAPLAPKSGKYSESPPAFQESWRADMASRLGSDPRVGNRPPAPHSHQGAPSAVCSRRLQTKRPKMLKTSTFRHFAQRSGEKCGLGARRPDPISSRSCSRSTRARRRARQRAPCACAAGRREPGAASGAARRRHARCAIPRIPARPPVFPDGESHQCESDRNAGRRPGSGARRGGYRSDPAAVDQAAADDLPYRAALEVQRPPADAVGEPVRNGEDDDACDHQRAEQQREEPFPQ